MSACSLAPTQFSTISWREQVHFQWGNDEIRFVLDQHARLDFYIDRNNSQWIDMSPHSDTFSWLQAKRSLLFLFNDVCLAEKIIVFGLIR